MKNSSLFCSAIFAFASFLSLMNCTRPNDRGVKAEDHAQQADKQDSPEGAGEAQTKPRFDVPQAFQQQLAGLFDAYVQLKDAFFASDSIQAKTEAARTEEALGKVDMKLLSGAAHHDWMTYEAPIRNSLADIRSADGLEAQRKAFSVLSDNLYKSIKAFGLAEREAYYEYCPMAFDNQGAYWLSNAKEIQNPYFGDEMPSCGEVRETIR